jgi:hypothetical protein
MSYVMADLQRSIAWSSSSQERSEENHITKFEGEWRDLIIFEVDFVPNIAAESSFSVYDRESAPYMYCNY